jgi:vacuolar-type H+-ATPase catalytic subunit A/Vma1
MQNELVSAVCFMLGVTCAITGSFGCGKTCHLARTYKGIASIYFLVVLW